MLSRAVLEKRNGDQVVSREFAKTLTDYDSEEGRADLTYPGKHKSPILMVSQLWIWRFGSVVPSAHSMTEGSSPQSPKLFLYNSLTCRGAWNLEIGTKSPEIHIGLIIVDCILKFGERQFYQSFPAPLDIFEIGVVRILSDTDEYLDPKNLTTLDIHKERELLHDIADIRSELAMIQEIFWQQEQVLDPLLDEMSEEVGSWDPLSGPKPKERLQLEVDLERIRSGRTTLLKHRKRSEKIVKDAERIEKMIQDQLNLKRTYASIRDTKTSIVLGTAVIGFTVITIIFAPLAFLASLSALPVDQFVRKQVTVGETKAYPTWYMGKWFGRYHAVPSRLGGCLLVSRSYY